MLVDRRQPVGIDKHYVGHSPENLPDLALQFDLSVSRQTV
jgi:hypothetical protein